MNWFTSKLRSKVEVRICVPMVMILCFLALGMVGGAAGSLYLGGMGLGGILALAILGVWTGSKRDKAE